MDRERHRPRGSDGLALEQRGMIADTSTAALVAADGTIEWYCPRRFDAPASLYRLLDPDGGSVRVGPSGTGRRPGTQHYDPGTHVLRTLLPAPDGELEVTDFMPFDGSGERPPGRIVRVAEVRRGTVDVEVEVTPGTAFGPSRRITSWSQGIAFDSLVVRAGIPFDGRRATTTLAAGDRLVVSVDLADAERHHQPLPPDAALGMADDTAAAWRRLLLLHTYDGPYRAAVERSLLVLHALTFHATGAVVGAVSTSLPALIGGERNFDARAAWVRDTGAALAALEGLGLQPEADRLTAWAAGLLESGRLPLGPVSDVQGDAVAAERELGLAGWRASQPVRTGNISAGDDRVQLDHFADLVGMFRLDHFTADGPTLHRWPDLVDTLDWLAEHWLEPDHGVWEIRSPARSLVSSKVSAWKALDAMARLGRARNPLDLDVVGWHDAARQAQAWLDSSPLVTATDGPPGTAADDDPELLDASLLRLPWRGPWPADHEVVTRAVDRILRHLSTGAHVHRYPPSFDDGLPAGEGAVTACSFWAVRALADLGRWEEAHERMDALCSLGRPLGLLSEQADPTSGALLGNLPHALTHASLIQAALALERGPA